MGVCELSDREPDLRLTDEGDADAEQEQVRLQVRAERQVPEGRHQQVRHRGQRAPVAQLQGPEGPLQDGRRRQETSQTQRWGVVGYSCVYVVSVYLFHSDSIQTVKGLVKNSNSDILNSCPQTFRNNCPQTFRNQCTAFKSYFFETE